MTEPRRVHVSEDLLKRMTAGEIIQVETYEQDGKLYAKPILPPDEIPQEQEKKGIEFLTSDLTIQRLGNSSEYVIRPGFSYHPTYFMRSGEEFRIINKEGLITVALVKSGEDK